MKAQTARFWSTSAAIVSNNLYIPLSLWVCFGRPNVGVCVVVLPLRLLVETLHRGFAQTSWDRCFARN